MPTHAQSHGPGPHTTALACPHLRRDGAGTVRVLVHICAGTDAHLRGDCRNAARTAQAQMRLRCLRVQADAVADRHADACADIDAHACADVDVRA